MAKRAAGFDRTAWDTGVSPVARSKAERCSVCKRGTDGRSFWVEEQVMCEGCADKSVAGIVPGTDVNSARALLLGVVAMMVIAAVYVMLHMSRG